VEVVDSGAFEADSEVSEEGSGALAGFVVRSSGVVSDGTLRLVSDLGSVRGLVRGRTTPIIPPAILMIPTAHTGVAPARMVHT
jgi:hypothetical protein